MKKRLVLIGAGGHAKVCYEIAKLMDLWREIIVLDDNTQNNFFAISGPISDYVKFKGESEFFVAIGSNDIRSMLLKKLISEGVAFATLIHPSAIISSFSYIETATVVMPLVVVNASSRIGKGVILNTASTIDHDSIIGDYVHISPGVNIAGNVTIGQHTWIGIGSAVKNNISIADDVIIGANSNVVSDLGDSGIYIGNPAHLKRSTL